MRSLVRSLFDYSAAPRVDAFTSGRDNNFNLIRVLAAIAVLISHSFPITRGHGAEDPVEPILGFSLGILAVFTFFSLSGFLISQSFDRSRELVGFTVPRVLRIVPGLAVVLLITIGVLGPLTTKMDFSEYVTNFDLVTYFARNLTLGSPQYDLLDVFENNPYPKAINGSLWTLIHEVLCYVGVAVFGLLQLKFRRLGVKSLVVIYMALYIAVEIGGNFVHPRLNTLQTLSFPFFIGMLMWHVRHHIPLDLRLVAVAFAAIGLSIGTNLFFEIFCIAWSYIIFYVGYVPSGVIRKYNYFGDYSYGIYIYAFPVQQLMVFLIVDMTPGLNILLALPLTVFLAFLSWHWVERPSLRTRTRILDKLERWRNKPTGMEPAG